MLKRTLLALLIGVILLFSVANAENVSPVASSVEASNSKVDVSVLDIVTPEYIKETQDIIMDFDAPLPIERIKNCVEAWKLRIFEGYKNEFREKGQNDEYWLNIGARGLYAFDNENYMGPEGGFVNYVSREEFFNEIVSGNAENFYCDDEGHPLSRLVNFTDKIEEGLTAGVKKLEMAGVNNLYEAWHESGASIFFADDMEPTFGPSKALVNQFGVVGFDITESNIGKAKLDNIFSRNLCELVAVSFHQTTRALGMNLLDGIAGIKWIGYSEMVKLSTYGEMLSCSNDKVLKRLGNGLIGGAKENADKYGLSMESDLFKRLVELTLGATEIPGEDLLKAEDE